MRPAVWIIIPYVAVGRHETKDADKRGVELCSSGDSKCHQRLQEWFDMFDGKKGYQEFMNAPADSASSKDSSHARKTDGQASSDPWELWGAMAPPFLHYPAMFDVRMMPEAFLPWINPPYYGWTHEPWNGFMPGMSDPEVERMQQGMAAKRMLHDHRLGLSGGKYPRPGSRPIQSRPPFGGGAFGKPLGNYPSLNSGRNDKHGRYKSSYDRRGHRRY